MREKSSSNYSTLVKRVVTLVKIINALQQRNNASHRNKKMLLIYHLILPLI